MRLELDGRWFAYMRSRGLPPHIAPGETVSEARAGYEQWLHEHEQSLKRAWRNYQLEERINRALADKFKASNGLGKNSK